MPKKQFMNKKTALRFEVVSRSLADATYVAGEGSEHILRPMNEAAAEAQFAAMARSQTARENAAAGGVQESKSGDAQEVGGLDDILGMAGVLRTSRACQFVGVGSAAHSVRAPCDQRQLT